ncbi:hypothetical protein AGMMS49928_04880 [Spirochaetia bacterium]|nr:hypothetical protein AGMMS49928_04880 [Spirochaetia bacterium]
MQKRVIMLVLAGLLGFVLFSCEKKIEDEKTEELLTESYTSVVDTSLMQEEAYKAEAPQVLIEEEPDFLVYLVNIKIHDIYPKNTPTLLDFFTDRKEKYFLQGQLYLCIENNITKEKGYFYVEDCFFKGETELKNTSGSFMAKYQFHTYYNLFIAMRENTLTIEKQVLGEGENAQYTAPEIIGSFNFAPEIEVSYRGLIMQDYAFDGGNLTDNNLTVSINVLKHLKSIVETPDDFIENDFCYTFIGYENGGIKAFEYIGEIADIEVNRVSEKEMTAKLIYNAPDKVRQVAIKDNELHIGAGRYTFNEPINLISDEIIRTNEIMQDL